MREMKNSGIEWIGDIPKDWALIRLKNCVEVLSGFPFESSYFSNIPGFPLIRIRDITSGSIETYYNGEYDESYIVHRGDLLVGMDGDFNVRWWESEDALLNQRCCKISTLPIMDKRYLYYCLPLLLKRVNDLTYSTTVKHLSVPDIVESSVPCIPQAKQKIIASFLDSACSHIDGAIAQTRASIEEYKKLKQSIITEAVTHGVRGERPMKDSGVEWIGEIPTDWDVRPIKNSFSIISGATPKSDNPDYWDGDIAWITPADFKFEDKYVNKGKRNLTKAGYDSCGTTLVPEGSIVFSKRAPIGTVVMTSGRICTNQGCLSCVPKKCVCSSFFYYTMAAYSELFNLYGTGTTFKEISFTSFSDFKLPLPPFKEQEEIATWLESECDEVEKLITKKQQLLTELEAYKKSVIFEYVTGKKEVPHGSV